MLGNSSHVEGSMADLLVFTGVLSTEEVLTAVEPAQWILLSVVRWQGELVVV